MPNSFSVSRKSRASVSSSSAATIRSNASPPRLTHALATRQKQSPYAEVESLTVRAPRADQQANRQNNSPQSTRKSLQHQLIHNYARVVLPPVRQRGAPMTTYKIISLRIVTAPATGIVLDAPPVLVASDHSVDYACGRCSTISLHAEEDQVRGFLIRCTKCGIYSSMDF